jgi:hypothetical protein
MPVSMAPRRKLIGFDDETLLAVELLSRDTGKTLQQLADEAFTDLRAKHHRPRTLKDALKQSSQRTPAKRTKSGAIRNDMKKRQPKENPARSQPIGDNIDVELLYAAAEAHPSWQVMPDGRGMDRLPHKSYSNGFGKRAGIRASASESYPCATLSDCCC